ncbi:DNA adenine methylase [Halobellus captivus]|uniref:DNA adenine methylase n=1 Tax=Halobellus captivus TaxID=2592614 RepID=UPI0011A5B7CF|nr:DNA adenine methylase [Halobellus captivus]
MPDAIFPYPGGKSRFASWILEQVPEHRCFVEVFGGAAGVLANKEPGTSTVEVYNDRDGDLVQFFEVLRDRCEELVEWLDRVPYSRELHEEWAHKFFNGYRPADEIKRAGQFFYLRYSQWGSKYSKQAGFGTSKVSSRALTYSNKIDRLDEFAERFAEVVIENLDWADLFEKYDSDETVFYCDPPYVGYEDYYLVNTISHEAFVDALDDLDGRYLCSYEDLPEGFEDVYVLDRDEKRFINNGTSGSAKSAKERLVMNFDPEDA